MLILKKNHIIAIAIGGVVVLGALLFSAYAPLQQNYQGKDSLEEKSAASKSQLFSFQGEVTSVNRTENSFAMTQPKEQTSFTVRLGETTKMIRLVFPFDINNPPPGAVFAPERKPIKLQDLKEGDTVFVRSSHPIEQGKDIVNPKEVQVLP